MKKYTLLLFACVLALQSCSSSQFAGTATGGFLGGMVGSAIGGIIGGPRGSDVGTLIGAATGAAVGAAATSPESQADRSRTHQSQAQPRRNSRPVYSDRRDYGVLSIENIYLDDYNRNGILESGEPAYLIVDIYNRGSRYVGDITPYITCSYSSVKVSPAATILGIEPGQGIRYRATIKTGRRLPNGSISFRVQLPDGTTRTFTARCRR
ncbi:MAG: hypothetical protein IJ816_04940 [Alloprevotella sp.]|nr:hypothetical protein [Alloprevotella sp.]